MSILNVNQIQPVGSGQTVTISAANITASSSTISASSFVGGVTVTSGNLTGISSVSTTNLTVNGNAYPSAGPLSNRNIVINGSMVVNQRGYTGAAGTTSGYTVDRFLLDYSHDGVVSVGQTTLTSTTGGNAYADGFQNALILRVTTADTSLAAGQYQQIYQKIEGYNVQGIKKGTANAQPVTLSFWVRSSTTGTYIAELYDNDNTRQISQAYTINAANTWEKKALTFPADTTGVFDNDNALSLYVIWWLAAGSTFSGGTLNTSWAAATATRAVGQVNALGTVGDFWLTGVQLEVGTVATPFEHRSYGDEFKRCCRYYQRLEGRSGHDGDIYTGAFYSTTNAYGPIYFPNGTMRTFPSVTITDNDITFYHNGTADNGLNFLAGGIHLDRIALNVQSVSGTAGDAGFLRLLTSADVFEFSAEL